MTSNGNGERNICSNYEFTPCKGNSIIYERYKNIMKHKLITDKALNKQGEVVAWTFKCLICEREFLLDYRLSIKENKKNVIKDKCGYHVHYWDYLDFKPKIDRKREKRLNVERQAAKLMEELKEGK